MTSRLHDLSHRELHTTINTISPWQTDLGLAALLELARRELKADSTSWLIVFSGQYGRDTPVIEWMDSWKVIDVDHHQLSRDEYWQYVDYCQQLAKKTGSISPLTRQAIHSVGTHRCHRLSGLNTTDTAYHHHHGNRDRLVGIYNLNSNAESYLLADRETGQLSETDSKQLLEILLTFPRLQHWLMLERGLAAQCKRPLPPRQTQLAHLLLQPLGKADIAREMGLAESTVHSYIIALYRNFQISSRPELMSLWLDLPPQH